MRNYQQKKKELSKQVFEILESRGYLLLEEERRYMQTGEYRTTLATNFNTITQAREVLRAFPRMGNISVNYDDFTILKNRVLFTVKPRPIDKNIEIPDTEPEALLE
ncbi:hypothetical protein G7051_00470 [Dysgonomonas sp. HDW5B]|uniref:hypothetical protein n=1 Tax=Dysgonomonas sp. HDW5B TaxID=2714927 RepID=UPI00140A453F|nr:hypothetical protein [Dysgonomonas sp. HDW5B]QIK52899.1 hypothetical protein G7051_00470 [Dysgonomonas sp. HDW5B]